MFDAMNYHQYLMLSWNSIKTVIVCWSASGACTHAEECVIVFSAGYHGVTHL